MEFSATDSVIVDLAGSFAGAGRIAVAHSRGYQPRAGAPPPKPFPWPEYGLEKHRGTFPVARICGACFCRAAVGTVVVLIGAFAQPESAQATPDEPLGNVTAPRFLYLSSVVGGNPIGAVSGPVTVEAYINGAGQVYDYRIVSGPVDETTREQVENLLLWSRFEPARRFGQPINGLAVLSFSGVSVRG